MRRAWLAAALAALAAGALAACGGPDPKELEPGLKDALRDLAKAVVVNDKEHIRNVIVDDAGMYGNPLGAKDAETPEGREKLEEANRRWIRACFRDAGIQAEKDVDVFINALKINIQGKNAQVTFEIAGEGRRKGEIVSYYMTKGEKGWRMYRYNREMIGMR